MTRPPRRARPDHAAAGSGTSRPVPPPGVPPDALDYRRIEVGRILVFLSPRMRRLPNRLDLDARGRRRQIKAYWDGCEYAA